MSLGTSLALGGYAERLDDCRHLLLQHSLYSEVNSIARLKLFMEDHVFAVWDFMSLLKRLQQDLTCIGVPWFPVADPAAARLINGIVLGEESDIGPDGNSSISHLELYLRAMEEMGAETTRFHNFCKLAQKGVSVSKSLVDISAPSYVRSFVERTMKLVSQSTTEEVLGAFLYGRENVIPEMFRSLRRGLGTACANLEYFDYYVLRHIELDGDSHGPMATELVARVASGSPERTRRTYLAAIASIEERINLWDGILRKVVSGP